MFKCCINCAMEDSKLQCRLFVRNYHIKEDYNFLESILCATTPGGRLPCEKWFHQASHTLRYYIHKITFS